MPPATLRCIDKGIPMDKQTVIRSPATPGFGKPVGAVNSAFDVGGKDKPARQVEQVDVAALKIEKGVPMPAATPGRQSPWPAVYKLMSKDDMVRLTPKQADSFVAWGKKAGVSLAKRRLGEDEAGVWRTA